MPLSHNQSTNGDLRCPEKSAFDSRPAPPDCPTSATSGQPSSTGFSLVIMAVSLLSELKTLTRRVWFRDRSKPCWVASVGWILTGMKAPKLADPTARTTNPSDFRFTTTWSVNLLPRATLTIVIAAKNRSHKTVRNNATGAFRPAQIANAETSPRKESANLAKDKSPRSSGLPCPKRESPGSMT